MVRSHPILSGFVGAYVLGFSAWAAVSGNREFLFYAAVMVVLIGLVAALHARVRLSSMVLWGLAAWGLLHMAGGNLPIPAAWAPDWIPPPGSGPMARTVLYNFRPITWMPKFDQVVHGFGFCVASLASFECLRSAVGGSLRASPGILGAVVCMGMGLGALNEVIEFAATRCFATNVGGYVNTGWDLVSNLVGCLVAAGVIWGRCSGSRGRTKNR